MKSLYDYQNNINIVTTSSGDKVITMSPEILTVITNNLYDAAEHHRNEGRYATASDLLNLVTTLWNKDDNSNQ